MFEFCTHLSTMMFFIKASVLIFNIWRAKHSPHFGIYYEMKHPIF